MRNFENLQEALHAKSVHSAKAKIEDGVFERLAQILNESLPSGELRSPFDAMALFRHCLRRESIIRQQNAQLRVPFADGWPDRAAWAAFGVRAHSEANGHCVIEAQEWRPEWLAPSDKPVFEDVFAERNVRLDWRRPIDPFLGDATGFQTYVSRGQREAVRSALLLPRGETLIVTLPTGSGKSLVAQAPVLTQGLEGGLTLCVVPTTALALDQARQTRQMLKRKFPRLEVPQLAWRAALDSIDRSAIKSAIREGRQGILYCSPEAITGALLPALYEAAGSGLIANLIIDEAHLVTQWGDGFRPAFQMLAGIRRGLLAACPHSRQFRTVMMSATMTPDTIETINALFGPKVQMVASVNLRPEPQYWIYREDDINQKERKVLEILRHAPRPFILYVTKRSDAISWLSILRRTGYERIDCFHGGTEDSDRLRIIEHWSQNRLDGIVATSAFGVGVDKPDVRTVVHATVPENLDRFYQEVGRGGRDGCPSASFMIYSMEDSETAYQIASPTLISDDFAFKRWSTMYQNSVGLDMSGQLLQVDLTTVAPWLRRQSPYNEAWNMRTLIMMARAGILTLESRAPSPEVKQENETDSRFEHRNEEYWSQYFTSTVVRMNELGHLNPDWFKNKIGQERLRSFRTAEENRKMLDQLISGSVEVSDLLDHLYRGHAAGRVVIVSKACGGCPEHRRQDLVNINYLAPPAYGIEHVGHFDLTDFKKRFPQLSLEHPIILPIREPLNDVNLLTILKQCVEMFSVREIATSVAFRERNPALNKLYQYSNVHVLLMQLIEEEKEWPSSYELPRVTLWDDTVDIGFLKYLFEMSRPLHVIMTPESTLDPWNRGRRIADTGQNILTTDQLNLGLQL